MIFKISSSQNEKYKHFKALKQKKARLLYSLYMVEGIKSVRDALNSSAVIQAILVSEGFYSAEEFKYPQNADLYIISDRLFPALSATEAPQGIIAVINYEKNKVLVPDISKCYIYCDRIQDPGNLGTIIRTADAAGFGGVFLSPDCVDLYNPKTVRSSMGSFFHIETADEITPEHLLKFKNKGFLIMCGILGNDTVEYTDADMTKPLILVIGNEANGICDEIADIADIKVKIPIDGKAESLNASVAASILMYECRRQRNI